MLEFFSLPPSGYFYSVNIVYVLEHLNTFIYMYIYIFVPVVSLFDWQQVSNVNTRRHFYIIEIKSMNQLDLGPKCVYGILFHFLAQMLKMP